MPYVDVSYEGRQQAERGQLDNGKLPHGGHRGSKRHPLMYLSFDKGRDFQDLIDQELSRVLEEEELSRYGYTPSWSILLHKSPSYTDESVLMRNDLLAANKLEQSKNYDLFDPTRVESTKSRRVARVNGLQYYRPNRTHQYLTSTELRDFAETDVDIKYGRPTRTTLLRARQRSNSAPQDRREFLHHLEGIRHSSVINSNPSYLDLQEVREGESLHSYLTGARYNRIHCLDAKSVDHSGVYMPRLNPALGCFFSGPKGLWYIDALKQQHNAEDSTDDRIPVPPPASPRLQEPNSQSVHQTRDTRVPPLEVSTGQSTDIHKPISKPDMEKMNRKHKNLELNVTGKQLSINGVRLPAIVSPRKSAINEELRYRIGQSKAVAPDIDDNRIKVEINQILAPIVDSPSGTSDAREDATEPPRHLQDGGGQGSSAEPEVSDREPPLQQPKHDTIQTAEADENIADDKLESEDSKAVTNVNGNDSIFAEVIVVSDHNGESKDINSEQVLENKDTTLDLETEAESDVEQAKDRRASTCSFHEALQEKMVDNEEKGSEIGDGSEDVVEEEEEAAHGGEEDQGENLAIDGSGDKAFFLTEDGFEERLVNGLVEDEL